MSFNLKLTLSKSDVKIAYGIFKQITIRNFNFTGKQSGRELSLVCLDTAKCYKMKSAYFKSNDSKILINFKCTNPMSSKHLYYHEYN